MVLRLLLVMSALALGLAASSTPDDASDSALGSFISVAPSVAISPSVKVAAEEEIHKLDQLHESKESPLEALGGLAKGLSVRGKNVAPALSPNNRDQVKKTVGSFAELLAAASAGESNHEEVDASGGNAGQVSICAFMAAATAGVVFSGFF